MVERVAVAGLEIAFLREGSGPPLLLLHGYVGDGPCTWRPQVEALSSDFTVIAWDAPGAGHSTDPPESWGMAGYADCVAAFLNRLDIDRAHIGGMSFGGALAIEFARRQPEMVESLILVSAYAGWAGSLPAAEVQRRLEQAYRLSELTSEEFCATLLPSMFHSPVPQVDAAAFEKAMAAFHPSGFRAMAIASSENLLDALPGIDVPTLLVYGDHDQRAPRTVAEHLHRTIKGSRLVFAPNAGHVCTLESPALVTDAMRDFLVTSSSR